MKLTKKNETSSKVTFTYDRPSGTVEGYTYFADGKRVAKTMNPADLEVTFGKVSSGKYAVEAVGFDTIDRAEWPEATTPPEPGPAPPGTVFFRGNFESGDFSNWLYVSDSLHGAADNASERHGQAVIVSNPVASGNYAVRLDLPADTRKTRVDLVTPNYPIALGQDVYYTTEFWLPSSWSRPVPYPNSWYVLSQYLGQQPNLWATPIIFDISQSSVRAVFQTGVTADGVGAQFNNGGSPKGMPVTYAIPDPEMNKEVWHQLIVRVRPAVDKTGVIEVWWRRRGESSWTQTVNLTGFPTLQWSSTGTPNPYLSCRDFCDAYRGPSGAASTIYHDNFCRASTFAAAESCFTNTSS